MQLTTAGQVGAEGLTVDTGAEFSLYVDDNDVTVVTPSVDMSVSHPLDGWSVNAGYLLDVVSAASVDIVATASPAWIEERHVGSAGFSYKPNEWQGQLSASVSREPDYLSLTGGGSLSVELADKHITPLIGYSYSHDTAGRSGTPYSIYSLVLERHTAQLSVAFVVNKATLLTLTTDGIFENGSQEKPYRWIPLFSSDTAAQLQPGESIDSVTQLRIGQMNESLPKTRQRYAFTARLAQRGDHSTTVLNQRLYADSWGLLASTTDLNHAYDVTNRFFVGPHMRLHVQNGASFYRLGYVGDVGPGAATVPAYRTGDRELSPLLTVTVGGAVLWAFATDWNAKLQADVGFTHYYDTLFINHRTSVLGALLVGKEF
jgi:hypothetical protein